MLLQAKAVRDHMTEELGVAEARAEQLELDLQLLSKQVSEW